MKYVKLAITLLLATVIGIFVCSPVKYMQSFFDGLTVWAYNVLPALFPFAVLTALMLKLKPQGKFSVTKKLFGVSCDYVWTMSLFCGYPIGSKAIADSSADTATATQMCSFCSTAGPIFMIATVGSKLLQSNAATAIILVSHIASAVTNGLLYRRKQTVELTQTARAFQAQDFGNTVTDSALSIISVGGIIALFYMLADMLKSFLPVNLQNNLAIAYGIGLMEMTNGVFAVCKLTNAATATVLCSGLLAFGGMCVFFQCYAYLGRKNIKVFDILKMKLTQSALATLFSFCLVKIFL